MSIRLPEDVRLQLIASAESADPAFAALTFPRFWRLWSQGAPATVVGARRGQEPVGLIIVGRGEGDDLGPLQIASIAVAPAHRRLGIGRSLLGVAGEKALEIGATRIVAQHSSRLPAREAYEALLRSEGWSLPREIYQRVAARADIAAEWSRGLQSVSARLEQHGFRTEPWAALTESDAAAIREQCAATSLRPSQHPWIHAPHCDPRVSILIRDRDQVAGWVLGQADVEPRHVFYRLAHVWPRYQRLWWLQAGMLDVARRQVDTFGPDSVLSFETRADNPRMRALMDRRFMALGPLWIDVRYESERLMTPGEPLL